MKLSIVVPVFNKVEFTVACMESLAETTAESPVEFEVIVVDNASSDATPGLPLRVGGRRRRHP